MAVSPPNSPKLKRYTNRPRRLSSLRGRFFNYLAEKSALQTVLQFFQMLSGSLQHQLLCTALEGHLRQGVAAHRLYRHHSALAESGVLHLVSLTELDQSHRWCCRGTAPAAGAEGLGRGFGALVGMDAAADITAGTARAAGLACVPAVAVAGGRALAAVRAAAEGGTAEIIAPAASAEAVLVIGAEFRFRLALPAHILCRDLI